MSITVDRGRRQPSACATGSDDPALTAMRVLIVDDNARNVDLLEQLLAQAGYRNVLSTSDSSSVPGICASWRPDLILLDIHMPGQSGFDVLRAIRDLMSPR